MCSCQNASRYHFLLGQRSSLVPRPSTPTVFGPGNEATEEWKACRLHVYVHVLYTYMYMYSSIVA